MRRAIYGGGLLASVGNFTMENAADPTVSIDEDDIQDWDFDETDNRNGIATITITGGIIGNLNADGTLINGGGRPGYNNGHVYGSGCGMVADALAHDQQYSQMGYVYRSRVNISQADADHQPTIIRGSVFGSGENGHVWEDTHVNISGGTIGAERNTTTDTDQHRFLGNVYGSGRGVASTNPDYQQAAFIKNSDVRILGSAHIYNNVYGGGNAGHVRKDTRVTIGTADGDAQPRIDGSVYGGGAGAATSPTAGLVNHDVTVSILGGTIARNVYGGGALANTNVHDRRNAESDDCQLPLAQRPECTTTVSLQGGTILGDAYGGGEGSTDDAAYVLGNVYGGGNNAEVTGSSSVQVGSEYVEPAEP